MINILVKEKGYITINDYDRAAHLAARLEEYTGKYIDFEVDESYFGKLTGNIYERKRKIHIKCEAIITIEDINTEL